MNPKNLKHKCFMVVTIIMSFMVFATPILAQQGELMAGRVAGEQAARARVNGTLWLLIGCIGGEVGIIVAYLLEPNPPSTQLLGKSPEYVAAYTDAYKVTAKSIQSRKAWTGCIASNVIAAVVYAVIVVAVAESTDDDLYYY